MMKRPSYAVFATALFALFFLGCARQVTRTDVGVGFKGGSAVKTATVREEPPPTAVQEAAVHKAAPVAPVELKPVFFDFDRYTLRHDSIADLRHDAEVLRGDPAMTVTIEGHCDERGTDEYNVVLGQNRADAVKKYLTDSGIDPARLSVISYGNEKPFCMEHTEQCWQRNRQANFAIRGK